MKVSVIMLTYGHEKYISEAIEGVLLQKTNFPFELIIANDHSPDNTTLIVKKYLSHKTENLSIQYLEREKNMGMNANFTSAFGQAKGEYIAMCEGDDYWIDENKLQKQVDFLQANKEYTICFHRVYEKVNDKLILSSLNAEKEETYSIKDLAKGNFIHTPSVVFRNGLIERFPNWLSEAPAGDYVLHMLNAKSGLIKYFPEPMAVYRKHSGTWSSQPLEKNFIQLSKVVEYLLTEDFNSEIKALLEEQRQKLILLYCKILLTRNDFSYLSILEKEIMHEPAYIRSLLMEVYPERIQFLVNSKAYKLAKGLSKAMSRFKRRK